MNYLQKFSVVLIAGVALSGCAGKGSRVKQIKKSPEARQTSELIMPTKDHPVGEMFKSTIKQKNYKALKPETGLSNNSQNLRYEQKSDKLASIILAKY